MQWRMASAVIRLDSIPTALACLEETHPGELLRDLGAIVDGQTDQELKELFAGSRRAFEKVYAGGADRWVCTFSGGKDSTLVAILAIDFLRTKERRPTLDVVYSDTQLEIPIMRETAETMLRFLRKVGRESGVDVRVRVVRPAVKDSFWVCMIGRGYPPPKPKFRWCTRRLKISPAEGYVDNGEPTAVLTGVRYGESASRTGRLMASCATGGECGQDYWFGKNDASPNVTYYAPVVGWRTCKVWDFLTFVAPAGGWPTKEVVGLYGDTTLRFGCWTCTLVRRDKTMEALSAGDSTSTLGRLHEFRNQLMEESKLWKNRWARSRSGSRRKGPLNLRFRMELLVRLHRLEADTHLKLISAEEEAQIRIIWSQLPSRSRGPLA